MYYVFLKIIFSNFVAVHWLFCW